jgi:hypothetical protein
MKRTSLGGGEGPVAFARWAGCLAHISHHIRAEPFDGHQRQAMPDAWRCHNGVIWNLAVTGGRSSMLYRALLISFSPLNLRLLECVN